AGGLEFVRLAGDREDVGVVLGFFDHCVRFHHVLALGLAVTYFAPVGVTSMLAPAGKPPACSPMRSSIATIDSSASPTSFDSPGSGSCASLPPRSTAIA